ncbi:enterobactin transporter EntS [Sphingomonas sp. RHCKR7]|nr:enterobactin transporter EntS [Sphingomonas folli]
MRRHRPFRALFVARLMSVFSLGILVIAVPVQIQALTGSVWQVSVATALDGAGMAGGMLVGGVLADRHDRRALILVARALCGVGFVLLALNGLLAAPSLAALYLVSAWDGFFGALGLTALMAATPALVGRADLAAAGALTMITVRMGAILAPLVGGAVLGFGGVTANYLLAGLGTLATLIPLTRLPTLRPPPAAPQHPLRAIAAGLAYLGRDRLVAAVMLAGTLHATFGATRVLFPALASMNRLDGVATGSLYAAVPLGAMLGAVTSGWVARVRRPGVLLLGAIGVCAAAVAALGAAPGLPALLIVLAVLGYAGSIAALVQAILVQTHTPEAMLGRVSSLWSAQDIVGETAGAMTLGAFARLSPLLGAAWLGLGGLAAAGALLVGCGPLRRVRGEGPPDGRRVDV